ncbi:YaaL family protein [Aquibacillus kalidii]|uniref:YaaL family protein n=1 Tax=Aquibacillus kalidii TaxID=2762597 RepID=UPI0016475E4F|nr:YaaL family protein [Aquibacillus kalidii]
MFSSKKLSRKVVDEQLLNDIYKLKDEWMSLKSIIERSVEPSEIGLYDLSVAQSKYFFLLREARNRNLSALHK